MGKTKWKEWMINIVEKLNQMDEDNHYRFKNHTVYIINLKYKGMCRKKIDIKDLYTKVLEKELEDKDVISHLLYEAS